MRFSVLVTYALLTLDTLAAYVARDDNAAALARLNELLQVARGNQLASFANQTTSQRRGQTCTKTNLQVRKEWGTLTATERIAYTKAVLCLQSLPAVTPSTLVPGAISRFDDFVGAHINQTVAMHYTGNFLAWHRYYTWNYEQTLRNECGYTGTQPYWNWGLFSSNPEASPVFDGSATSMSGNGKSTNNSQSISSVFPRSPNIHSRSGTGGGCVTSGPFKDMVVNLGPVTLPFAGSTKLNGAGMAHNPRCLRRDINPAINRDFASARCIVDLILQNQNIWDFEMTMQGFPGSSTMGVHQAGHYTIGGDPGSDAFVSPGEPVFYLHHAMIDLVWWIWQNLDSVARTNAISGTGTLLNLPPSPNTTLDTIVDMGYSSGGPLPMRELMSTINGPFCYMYL